MSLLVMTHQETETVLMKEGKEGRYKLLGSRNLYRLYSICFVFLSFIIICPLYKSTLLDQSQVILQLGVRCHVKIFSQSAPVGVSEIFFSPGPKPPLGDPEQREYIWKHYENFIVFLILKAN